MGRFWRAFLASFCLTMLVGGQHAILYDDDNIAGGGTNKDFWEGIFGRFLVLAG